MKRDDYVRLFVKRREARGREHLHDLHNGIPPWGRRGGKAGSQTTGSPRVRAVTDWIPS